MTHNRAYVSLIMVVIPVIYCFINIAPDAIKLIVSFDLLHKKNDII